MLDVLATVVKTERKKAALLKLAPRDDNPGEARIKAESEPEETSS
jgi:hypothetical protein